MNIKRIGFQATVRLMEKIGMQVCLSVSKNYIYMPSKDYSLLLFETDFLKVGQVRQSLQMKGNHRENERRFSYDSFPQLSHGCLLAALG